MAFDFRPRKIFFEFWFERLPGFFRIRGKKAVVNEYFESLTIERYRHFLFETVAGCERGLVGLRETRLKGSIESILAVIEQPEAIFAFVETVVCFEADQEDSRTGRDVAVFRYVD